MQENDLFRAEYNELRKQSQRMASRFPNQKLFVDINRHEQDPHVDRLLESFAFLTGRLQRFMDAQFPELVQAFFSMIYPQYLRPSPTQMVVCLHSHPDTPLTQSVLIEKGHRVVRPVRAKGQTGAFHDCIFTTVWDHLLQPVEIIKTGSDPDHRFSTQLTLKITGGARVSDIKWDQLVFYIRDSNLQDEIFMRFNRDLEHMAVKDLGVKEDKESQVFQNLKIRWLAFEDAYDEEDARYRFRKLHFLRQFFGNSTRFSFFRIEGLEKVLQELNAENELQDRLKLSFVLSEPYNPSQEPETSTFQLNSVPVHNLYEGHCAPIAVDGVKSEYLLEHEEVEIEVHSILDVVATNDHSDETEVNPFYSFKIGLDPDQQRLFYITKRDIGPGKGYDTYIRFIERGEEQASTLAGWNVTVRALLSTPDLAQHTDEQELKPDPTQQIRLKAHSITGPISSYRPSLDGPGQWGFLAHLALDYTELSDLDNFKALLHLYNLPGGSRESENRQLIDGVKGIERKETVKFIKGCCLTGVKYVITVKDFLNGGRVILFKKVIEAVMEAYCPINGFIQLEVHDLNKPGKPYCGEVGLKDFENDDL